MATETQIHDFINKIYPYAQKYAKKYGYAVCSPCIAQALQESLSKSTKPEGLSQLAYEYHNYHGIKTYPKWTGKSVNMKTGEEVNNAIMYVQSNFCVFENTEDAIENYYLFLERNPRYRNLKACVTPQQYLETIRADGYATDSSYAVSCMQKVNKYQLYIYDDIKTASINTTYEIGQVYTTQEDLYIRDNPMGDKVKHGNITTNAQAHAFFDDYGNAILKKGTRVTCKGVVELTGSTWINIPSGWICAKNTGKIYIV